MEVLTIQNDKFNDIAFVTTEKLFNAMKEAYDEFTSRGDYAIYGFVYSDGEYIRPVDVVLKKSKQIVLSELTHESLENYKSQGYVVYFISHKTTFSHESQAEKAYTILDVLAPKLCIAHLHFAFDHSIDVEYNTEELYFISFDTRGGRTYGHGSVDNIEMVEMPYSGLDDYTKFYETIDNTVFISTDKAFDSGGWICGGGEGNYVYCFNKNDGAFECYIKPKEGTRTKHLSKYDKDDKRPYTIEDVQLCPLYTSSLYADNPYDEKYRVKGIVNFGGKIFDTINCSFISYDREWFTYEGCFVEEIDNDTWLVYEDGEWEITLRRKDNGSLELDEEQLSAYSDDDE
jgi:hypothetical protein